MWLCAENVIVDVITICYIAIKWIQYLDHCDNITMNRVAGEIVQKFSWIFLFTDAAGGIDLNVYYQMEFLVVLPQTFVGMLLAVLFFLHNK